MHSRKIANCKNKDFQLIIEKISIAILIIFMNENVIIIK